MTGSPRRRVALNVAVGALGAAMYAVLILPAIMINLGPLGIANLRPAVVVPMAIASVFGPWPGFVCAAFGNSIADLFVYGPDPGTIPGFVGSGVGAVVTASIAEIATRRFKGGRRIAFVVFGSALGLGWIAGLIVGVGNLLMGFIPTLGIALIVASLIGVGNTIFACTILPPLEIAIRKIAHAKGVIQD